METPGPFSDSSSFSSTETLTSQRAVEPAAMAGGPKNGSYGPKNGSYGRQKGS